MCVCVCVYSIWSVRCKTADVTCCCLFKPDIPLPFPLPYL